MKFEPYKPPVQFEHETHGTVGNVIGETMRAISFPAIVCFTALLYVGFISTAKFLAIAGPFRGWLIAGLACQRGWREAVHEMSCIASLYPHVIVVCIVLGLLRVPRTWLFGAAAILLGFTANLIWGGKCRSVARRCRIGLSSTGSNANRVGDPSWSIALVSDSDRIPNWRTY